MQLVYYSMTNNTKRFVDKLDDSLDVSTIYDYDGHGDYVLMTPTYNIGQIPDDVQKFLDEHSDNIIGVIATGNKNWGQTYALAGKKIAVRYEVTLLHMMELSGNSKDVERVNYIIKELERVDIN